MNRKTFSALLRQNFEFFMAKAFTTICPGNSYLSNWHIKKIAEYLEKVRLGEINRLIINMPPRYLKSVCISVAWSAWLLGKNPSTKIMTASYSQVLSNKHSQDCRLLLSSDWYKDCFNATRIVRGENQKSKFVTTNRGFRFATSTGGTATGEGGDILIVDDPQNPNKINSKKYRDQTIEWFEQTFISRLNNILALASSIVTASYLYYSAKDKPEGEVIVINADNEEIKVKPEDPGGMVVANMDRVIYDTIDGYKEDNQEEVKILPPTEEPIDKQALIESIKPVENLIEKKPLVEEVIVEDKLEEKSSSGDQVNEFIKPTVTAETSSKLLDLKKINEKSYMVQLASFRAKSDAEKEWKNLSRRHAKILSKYQYVIVSKNFEGKGLFYRLQVGPFESEAEAVKICKSFKESGINCITVK